MSLFLAGRDGWVDLASPIHLVSVVWFLHKTVLVLVLLCVPAHSALWFRRLSLGLLFPQVLGLRLTSQSVALSPPFLQLF